MPTVRVPPLSCFCSHARACSGVSPQGSAQDRRIACWDATGPAAAERGARAPDAAASGAGAARNCRLECADEQLFCVLICAAEVAELWELPTTMPTEVADASSWQPSGPITSSSSLAGATLMDDPASLLDRLCPAHGARYVIFRELWSRQYYVTPGIKFGGHFLVYERAHFQYEL